MAKSKSNPLYAYGPMFVFDPQVAKSEWPEFNPLYYATGLVRLIAWRTNPPKTHYQIELKVAEGASLLGVIPGNNEAYWRYSEIMIFRRGEEIRNARRAERIMVTGVAPEFLSRVTGFRQLTEEESTPGRPILRKPQMRAGAAHQQALRNG